MCIFVCFVLFVIGGCPTFSGTLLGALKSDVTFIVTIGTFAVPNYSFGFVLASFPIASLSGQSLECSALSGTEGSEKLCAGKAVLHVLSPGSLVIVLSVYTDVFVISSESTVQLSRPSAP